MVRCFIKRGIEMTEKERLETDFHIAMAQADKLDEITERLAAVSEKKLGSALQDLSRGWKGENASAYLRKGAKLQGRISGTSLELHSIAEDMRSRARRIYGAEQN